MAPAGRAFLKGAPYTPAHELPSEDYPLLFTTGRTVFQFHTRTKTGRARSLNQAAPDAWVELSPTDAAEVGIAEGDWVRLESPRGAIEVRARIGRVMEGAVFAPFHYGHWDPDNLTDTDHRSANELTMTVWDPVSKQPYFKTAACRAIRLRGGDGPSPDPGGSNSWNLGRPGQPPIRTATSSPPTEAPALRARRDPALRTRASGSPLGGLPAWSTKPAPQALAAGDDVFEHQVPVRQQPIPVGPGPTRPPPKQLPADRVELPHVGPPCAPAATTRPSRAPAWRRTVPQPPPPAGSRCRRCCHPWRASTRSPSTPSHRCSPHVGPAEAADRPARRARSLVARRDRLGHSPPLAHRQSHHRGLPVTPDRLWQARPTRAFLDESTNPSTRALLMSQRARLTDPPR